MKRAFVVGVLWLFVSLPANAGDAFVAEIVRQAAQPKDALFDQTVLWMAENFQSSKDVIELKDKGIGVIVGNGASNINVGMSFMPTNVPVVFKLRIDIKDKKYRMTFSNVKLAFDAIPKPIEDTNREANEAKVREAFEQLANSLDAHLANPPKDF